MKMMKTPVKWVKGTPLVWRITCSFTVVAFVFYVAAFSTRGWRVHSTPAIGGSYRSSYGLFSYCDSRSCKSFKHAESHLRAAQAMACLALIAICGALIGLIVLILPPPCRGFRPVRLFVSLSSFAFVLFALLAVIIYATFWEGIGGAYSVGLAVVATVFQCVVAVVMLWDLRNPTSARYEYEDEQQDQPEQPEKFEQPSA